MSKRVKVLVAVLAVVVLLSVGGVATVMAQDQPAPPPAGAPKGLFARVAAILGISEETLANAFQQAQQEMREEAFIRGLDKAVEKGRLTQEQANEIKEWWQQRPGILESGPFPPAFGFMSPHGGHMRGKPPMRGWHKGWQSDNTTQTG